MNNQNNQVVTAVIAKLNAQKEEAKAVLLTYFTNSTGTGGHSSFVEEAVEWSKKLAEAESSLAALTNNFIGAAEPPMPTVESDTDDA